MEICHSRVVTKIWWTATPAPFHAHCLAWIRQCKSEYLPDGLMQWSFTHSKLIGRGSSSDNEARSESMWHSKTNVCMGHVMLANVFEIWWAWRRRAQWNKAILSIWSVEGHICGNSVVCRRQAADAPNILPFLVRTVDNGKTNVEDALYWGQLSQNWPVIVLDAFSLALSWKEKQAAAINLFHTGAAYYAIEHDSYVYCAAICVLQIQDTLVSFRTRIMHCSWIWYTVQNSALKIISR